MFPKEFITYTGEILGSDTDALLEALDNTLPPVSVRFNPFKTGAMPSEVGGMALSSSVPWCRYGAYLAQRPSFTTDPLFHAGTYYVQEASSMFVEHAIRHIAGEGMRILDLCAAPGGKATLYSTLAGPEGLVVANEVIRTRASVLADNVRKWGIGNVIVTNEDPAAVGRMGEWFDIVAVDAPCSGEGMFRKVPAARAEWSADNVRICSQRQRRILADAYNAVAPGGYLIYSTCTFNRFENEDNVEWFAEEFDMEDAGIDVPGEWNIVGTEAGGIRCFRFFPHLTAGEGFFCAVMRKPGMPGQSGKRPGQAIKRSIFAPVPKQDTTEISRWAAQPGYMTFSLINENVYGYYSAVYNDMKTIAERLNALHSGVCMGQMFNGKLKPDHSLAMFHDSTVPAHAAKAELGMEDSLRFLRKEDIKDTGTLAEGLNMITYLGRPLGWAKRIGNRTNNMYPKSLMIQNK